MTPALVAGLTALLIESHATQAEPSDAHVSSEWHITPHLVHNDRLPTMASGMLLNDRLINHRTEWQLGAVAVGGNDRNTSLIPDLLFTVRSEVEQAVTRDNVFISDQRSEHFQIGSEQNRRDVRLTIEDPKTMLGLELQTTLTGECSIIGKTAAIANSQCSYTPGLAVDRSSIDPALFVPTVIRQEGQLGQEISPESLIILARPGFQNRGANGELIGLDIFLPNIALVPRNELGTKAGVTREDSYGHTQQAAYSRVRQVLKSNADEAVFARTIHGLPYVHDNDHAALGPVLALFSLLLPDVTPDLEGTADPHSTRVNTNLLRAANNSRLPARSLAIYQAGFGRSDHPQAGAPPPDSWFNNVWFGLSPVTERTITNDSMIVLQGAQTVLGAAGAEGGTVDILDLVVEDETGRTLVDSQLLPSTIDDFYLQLYLALFSRNVSVITTSKLREETHWYPHIGATGNLTSNRYLWRYFGGVITSPEEKVYIGTDFTHHIGMWSYHAGATHYHGQDIDYFSQVNASVVRKFALGDDWQARIFSDWRYAYDRPPAVRSLLDPPDNYARVGINVGYTARASLDVYRYLDVIEETIPGTFGADFRYSLGEGWKFKSWLHPGTEVDGYGASLEYSGRSAGKVFAFSASWNHLKYEYGDDLFGNRLSTNQNAFVISLNISR